MQELRWWLLHHVIKVPTLWKKTDLISTKLLCKNNQLTIFRIAEARIKLVDVDGSYLYLKQQKLMNSGVSIAPASHPASPLIG